MDKKKAEELLNKYNQGECTPEEKALVERWYHDLLAVQPYPPISQDPGTQQAESLESLQAHLAPRPRKLQPYYWAAAALFIVALATALYFYQSSSIVNRKSKIVNDIAPGYNQATLTLADGTKVELDSAKRGIQINNEHINYNDGTKIRAASRNSSGSPLHSDIHHSSSITYNFLTTPKGGQYQIILEDGTKVWLNAASTLKYPSRFSKDKREVFLEGEAFFDVNNRVAGDRVSRVPFIVKSKNQEIDVLGTSFNVASYAEESTARTTLVSGAIQVASNVASENGSYTLKPTPYTLKLAPGEQSMIQHDGKITKAKVDLESETAWRDNLFIFHNEPLESIMAKVARWYNVEIIYAYPEAKQLLFWGEVSRATPISSVLKNLEMTGRAHFTIAALTGAERRVTVTK